MCRIYGFRANQPTKVECTLVRAQNALMIQSRADLRGISHGDGWGIAIYSNTLPSIERRATAAHSDLYFSVAAERAYVRTSLAHVRRATVGQISDENTHPFQTGRWTFAHNGTVTAFDRVGPSLKRETDPGLLKKRRGSTDSELAFLWLLSFLRSRGLDLDEQPIRLGPLASGFSQAVRLLARRCDQSGAAKAAQLNFLLTEGNVLVASRWGNTLYWLERRGVYDCEICGIPHVQPGDRANYRAVVIASEPISSENWVEVPDRHLIVVSDAVRGEIVGC